MQLSIINECLLVPNTDCEQRDLAEIFERGYHNRSTILCSQFSKESWHSKLGGGAIADAILEKALSNFSDLLTDENKIIRKKHSSFTKK